MMLGGEKLGKGAFGVVRTLDELPRFVPYGANVYCVFVKVGTDVAYSKAIDLGTLVREFQRGVIFKAGLQGVDLTDELDGNVELLRAVCAGMVRNKVSATRIEEASPFFLINRSHFLAGIIAERGNTRTVFPVYRKMDGDLTHFYKLFGHTMTAKHVLDVVMATLVMLQEMRQVGAFHRDIKEPNLLYKVVCPSRAASSRPDFSRPGGCHVKFALSDYGLIMVNPTSLEHAGTPGFMSPAYLTGAFGNDHRGAIGEYVRWYLVGPYFRRDLTPQRVWMSYGLGKDQQMTRRQRTSPAAIAAITEKNDLHALGVMLSFFDYGADARSRPFAEFVRKLILGPRDSNILTIQQAMSHYRELRTMFTKSEYVVHIPIDPSAQPLHKDVTLSRVNMVKARNKTRTKTKTKTKTRTNAR
jgi:serine/threonine protein kinase